MLQCTACEFLPLPFSTFSPFRDASSKQHSPCPGILLLHSTASAASCNTCTAHCALTFDPAAARPYQLSHTPADFFYKMKTTPPPPQPQHHHHRPSIRHKVKDESKTVLEECHSTSESVLDSLVKTILSQNTTDVQSSKGFRALKAVYPTWEAVRLAPAAAVEAPVKSCGLAEIKVARIHSILNTLKEERGECTLEYVRKMSEAGQNPRSNQDSAREH